MLAYSSSCYSEEIFGSSTPVTGYNWVMTNILPQQAGLTVNNVIYRYTTEKITEDPFTVAIQNEDAVNGGYIFREVDDWTGLPGNTINKLVSVGGIPIERWGDGSIETTGFGTVKNSSVVYTYQYDPCFDPQSNPECPGYIDQSIVNVPVEEFYDPLNDTLIQEELDKKADLKDEEQEELDRKRVAEQKKKERLEVALGAVNSAAMTAEAESKAAELFAMSMVPQTYITEIKGGTYEETVQYVQKPLQDNRKGRRVGLAQQLLHEEMVQSQFENISKSVSTQEKAL